MGDAPESTPELDDSAIERIARAVVAESLTMARRVDLAGKRLNTKPRRPAGYTYIYLEAVIGLGLSGAEWDLLFALASRADQKGTVVYSAASLCKQLNIDRSNFHTRVRRIVATGILRRVGQGTLQLNPNMLWHGSSSTQVALLSEEIGDRLRARLLEEGLG